MSTHIVHIDGDTDIAAGLRIAADKIAASQPEERARKLVSHMAMLIFMLSYVEKTGKATEQEKRDISIFRECFRYAELPELGIELSTHQ